MSNSPLPLDQDGRDWTKGNCYYAALEFIKDFPGLAALGYFDPTAEVWLVHGMAGGVKHAWIELSTGEVIDNANDAGRKWPKERYYEVFNALPVRRFSRLEADAILASRERNDPGFKKMTWSWHEVTETEIAAAVASYEPSTAPFARNVSFSDPSDPANVDRIERAASSVSSSSRNEQRAIPGGDASATARRVDDEGKLK